jgi:hypothetical protein
MAGSGILPGTFRGTFHLHDYSVYQALGLLVEGRPYYQSNTCSHTRGPTEPLVYKGNPQPSMRGSCGNRPGLSR